jgi:hypothetical protein
VNLLRRTHLKQTQSQPLSNRLLEENDNLIIEDEIVFGRNLQARKFGQIVDDELSEYVRWRLWRARQMALAKYREKWV